jgi:hypothetical protein
MIEINIKIKHSFFFKLLIKSSEKIKHHFIKKEREII